jgi:hypothetical protein
MGDASVLRVGGLAALALAVATALAAIIYLLLPAEQRAVVTAAEILPSVAAGAPLLMTEFYVGALTGVFGLALVPAVKRLVGPGDEGWLGWASALAYVGYAVTIVGFLLSAARLPGIAQAYAAGDEAVRAALQPLWRSSIDQNALLTYGAVGVWIVVASVLGRRHGRIASRLSWLGIAAGVLAWLGPLGSLVKLPEAVVLFVALGGLLLVVWYGWIGLTLLRGGAEADG